MKIGREKFWVDGMGAEARYAFDGILGRYDLFQYGQPNLVVWSVGKDRWLDPFSAAEVRLEVLLGGLERLAERAYVAPCEKGYLVYESVEQRAAGKCLAISEGRTNESRRTAIILAILKLCGLEMTE